MTVAGTGVVAILAGGAGTRLRSRSGMLPKPMVPVAGRPVLEHQIAACAAAGLVDIVLLVHHAHEATATYFGDGSPRKSYLHVDDCVAALLHICLQARPAQSARHRFQALHLGHPSFCQVRDSVRWICDELGLEPALHFGSGDRGWVGDNPFVFLDVSRAIATGWQPRHGIEASVRATARWLADNAWILEERA